MAQSAYVGKRSSEARRENSPSRHASHSLLLTKAAALRSTTPMLTGKADPATVRVLHCVLDGTIAKNALVSAAIPAGIRSSTWPRSTIRSTLSGASLFADMKLFNSAVRLPRSNSWRVSLIPIPLLTPKAIAGATSAVREIPVTGVKGMPSVVALVNASIAVG